MTVQQKLEAYKRQIKRELEAQFEQRVNDEALQWFDHSLQMWINRFEAAERQIKEFGEMINRRKPILSNRKFFRLIKASVQPDKGGTICPHVGANFVCLLARTAASFGMLFHLTPCRCVLLRNFLICLADFQMFVCSADDC
jgi:hypothetical protein